MVSLRVSLPPLVVCTAILGGLWLVPAALVPGGAWD